jgi:transcriptional regulator with XRE-family HTH domain
MTIRHSKSAKSLKILQTISGKTLTLGNLLMAIREGECLSRTEFSLQLGISKQYLCDVEHGRRFVSPKAAIQFAEKLGYSQSQFLRLSLQDIINRYGIHFQVNVKAA